MTHNIFSGREFSKILITGGTGYLGRNIANYLSEKCMKVAILSRQDSESIRNQKIFNEQVEVYQHNNSIESLRDAFRKFQPTIIVHNASFYVAEHKPGDIGKLIESNVLYGALILDLMSEFKVQNFVNLGTVWENYENKVNNPLNLYASTKQAFQAILNYYYKLNENKFITLRLADTYGPNDPRNKILNQLLDHVGSEISLDMSAGEQLVDLVHVEDVMKAVEVAVHRVVEQKNPMNESWMVGSGSPVTLKNLVGKIEKISGIKANINWGVKKYRKREVFFPFIENQLPGWSPAHTLEVGIEELWSAKKSIRGI